MRYQCQRHPFNAADSSNGKQLTKSDAVIFNNLSHNR
nr:MAG TPA: hypothetical protein [Crassvirales sp.]